MTNLNDLLAKIKLLETKIVIYSHQADFEQVRDLDIQLKTLNNIVLELMTLNPQFN